MRPQRRARKTSATTRNPILRLECRHVANGSRGVDQIVAIPRIGANGAKADLCPQCAALYWE